MIYFRSISPTHLSIYTAESSHVGRSGQRSHGTREVGRPSGRGGGAGPRGRGAGGARLRLSGEWSLVSQVWLKVAGWLGQPSRAADECGRPFSPAALLAAPLRSPCPPCRRPPRRWWAAYSLRRSRLRRAGRVACALRPPLARRRLARTRCLGAVAAAAAAAAACRRAASMRGTLRSDRVRLCEPGRRYGCSAVQRRGGGGKRRRRSAPAVG